MYRTYVPNWVQQITICDDIAISIVYRVQRIMCCSIGTIRTRMPCHYQYCLLGAINIVLSNGNLTNDTTSTVPSSSLLVDAVAVAVTLPWVQHVLAFIRYLIGRHGNN